MEVSEEADVALRRTWCAAMQRRGSATVRVCHHLHSTRHRTPEMDKEVSTNALCTAVCAKAPYAASHLGPSYAHGGYQGAPPTAMCVTVPHASSVTTLRWPSGEESLSSAA